MDVGARNEEIAGALTDVFPQELNHLVMDYLRPQVVDDLILAIHEAVIDPSVQASFAGLDVDTDVDLGVVGDALGKLLAADVRETHPVKKVLGGLLQIPPHFMHHGPPYRFEGNPSKKTLGEYTAALIVGAVPADTGRKASNLQNALARLASPKYGWGKQAA
jgi:hypothetical protein